MRISGIILTVVVTCACIALHGSAFSEPEAVADAFPKVRLPEPKYEFSDIVEGRPVVHDFVIQNKGNATLDIEKVKPG